MNRKYRLSSDFLTAPKGKGKNKDKDKEKKKPKPILLTPQEKRAVLAVLVAVPLVVAVGVLLRPLFSGKGSVHGTVTLNGAPVPWGRISFVGETGYRVSKTSQIKNGRYEIKDIPTGPVKISVESFQAPALAPGSATNPMVKGFGPPKGAEPPPEVAGKYLPIPPRYGSPDTSDLEYTVRRGDQEHDVPLSP